MVEIQILAHSRNIGGKCTIAENQTLAYSRKIGDTSFHNSAQKSLNQSSYVMLMKYYLKRLKKR